MCVLALGFSNLIQSQSDFLLVFTFLVTSSGQAPLSLKIHCHNQTEFSNCELTSVEFIEMECTF